MPVLGTLANASARAYGFTSAVPEVLGGMVLVTPTSITSTGTGNSSSINSNGSVTFSSCVTLSLNGVFTSSYDNYMVTVRSSSDASNEDIRGRLRLSGTDSTATTDYNHQYLTANGTFVLGGRVTADGSWQLAANDNDYRNGFTMYVFGPNLAQPTAYRTVTTDSSDGVRIFDVAGTHELSSSYDGITMTTGSGVFTGLVSVYGLVGA